MLRPRCSETGKLSRVIEAKNNSSASQSAKDRDQRLQNVRALLAMLGGLAGVMGAGFSIISRDFLGGWSTYYLAASAILTGICAGYVVSLYLNGKLSLGTTVTITSTSGSTADAIDHEALTKLRGLMDVLSERVSSYKAESETAEAALLSQCRQVFEDSRSRLLRSGVQIDRRSRVSLVTGSAISAAAVVTLLAFAFPPIPLVSPTWQQLLSMYLPKIGVIVMLEVFAFFFLGLYKASLKDSRALNDDLNSLDLKEASLLAAWTEASDQRLLLAKMLIPEKTATPSLDAAPLDGVDPKALAELVAAVTKLVRG